MLVYKCQTLFSIFIEFYQVYFYILIIYNIYPYYI